MGASRTLVGCVRIHCSNSYFRCLESLSRTGCVTATFLYTLHVHNRRREKKYYLERSSVWDCFIHANIVLRLHLVLKWVTVGRSVLFIFLPVWSLSPASKIIIITLFLKIPYSMINSFFFFFFFFFFIPDM
uniref:Uncharacterized protein n=1 Tax=Trypanosoma vivax (strain Y486) TaxID=1055687 RepID=G0TWN3_TRYVY|nr:hypothetical protein TVY486_0601620 [Trypanosoma vivax Y486]